MGLVGFYPHSEVGKDMVAIGWGCLAAVCCGTQLPQKNHESPYTPVGPLHCKETASTASMYYARARAAYRRTAVLGL